MPNSNPKTWAVAGVVVVVIALLILAIRMISGRSYHFLEVDHGKLYRDGLKTSSQFLASCEKGHAKTVVSLVGNDEISNDRFGPVLAECAKRGLVMKHIPIHISSWPTSTDIQSFLAIAADPANQPVIVHCREGIRRTGMMSAAYQMSVLGYSRDQARAAIQSFGHSDRLVADLTYFIDHYDPATRTFTAPPSTTMPSPVETD